jgi:arylsulfatase A
MMGYLALSACPSGPIVTGQTMRILPHVWMPLLLSITAMAADRPNIILILADDLGYETIGANGGTSYKTPVLDGLAAGGARFTHCYAQPLCTPTRVQLMTGRSNARNYLSFGTLDPQAVTIGNHFKNAGYATCITGKWQLGHALDLPQKFGFDEHCLWQHTRRPPRYANPGLEINGVRKDYSKGEYGPDIVNDYALEFIARHSRAGDAGNSKPFFLYYPMMLTHDPYQPTPDSKDWDPKALGEKVNHSAAHFGDMVEYMDKLIGKVIAKLDACGLRDNTLVIFLGDNGTGGGTRSLMGQRVVIGGKGRTLDAGMHVPLIANWPGHIAKAGVCGDLVDTTDFLPTLCEAAAVKLAAPETLDGRSFYPQLRGEKGNPRPWIYVWYSPRQGADKTIREFAFDQHFKLYRSGKFFDLTKDRDEKTPLAADSLTGDAATAAKALQLALDQFKGARPANLPP